MLVVNGDDDRLLLFVREEVRQGLAYDLRQIDLTEKLLIKNHSGSADDSRLIVNDGFQSDAIIRVAVFDSYPGASSFALLIENSQRSQKTTPA